MRNLPIAQPFQKAQGKDLRLPRLQLGHCAGQVLPEAERVGPGWLGGGPSRKFFGQRNSLIGLPCSNYVEGGIDRRPAQVAFSVFQRVGSPAPPQQAQKNCLQHIFGVTCVAGNPVGRAEHLTVVVPKSQLEFVRNCDRRFL